MKRLNKKIIPALLTSFLVALYFLPGVSLAADLSLTSDKNIFAQSEEFLVEVSLDTEAVTVNAVEGVVVFPAQFLELKEVRDGNSSVNFWIEKPHEAQPGKVVFSGITTGGFSGSDAFLFGMVFKTKKMGAGAITLSDLQILKNDGLGTKVSTKQTPFNFSISSELSTSTLGDGGDKDMNPPEDFNIFLVQDPSIFDGKYFVVFSTVDKGVGVDHYEVRESFLGLGGKYVASESPHLLKNQMLKNKVYVKAIDKSGNERIVKLSLNNKLAWLTQGLIFAIIALVCVSILKKYRRNSTRQ